MNIRNEVLYRMYFLLFGLVVPAAAVLVYRTIEISVIDGERWRTEGQADYVRYRQIRADRGNILASDGSLLATSIPYFDIYFDPVAPAEKDFAGHIDSLAFCLATFVDDTYTPGGYRDYLLQLRRDSTNRHLLIKSRVSFNEKRKLESFPLFRMGRFRGGFIAEQVSERRRPFGLLAQRTIGYVREGAKPVGLEGFYNDVLEGEPGGQYMICVDRRQDIWMPLEDLAAIDPQGGDDVVTTIDVNLQDIVENALVRALNYHDAEWGTAVLMDTKTGAIKAIANLGRMAEGWWETYNYAVGSAIEPGSTFKTASMLAMLEDGTITLEDTVDIEHGKTQFYKETMVDSSPESATMDSIPVRKAFEMSSNVGIAKLVTSRYGGLSGRADDRSATKYIKRLKQFNLHLPTGVEIEGEADPYIKEAYSQESNWSGTTLPWMSIGYELRLTPLQLLTFYNAIANGGTMMRPYLVQGVQRNGEMLREFRPTVVKRHIASEASIAQIRELLEGVVERGTARKLSTDKFTFAGKTGTSQINYQRLSETVTRVGGYRASFVGYFPADNPRFSCIVVISKPNRNGIYGSDVAGPVFREIADKVFATTVDLHPVINEQPRPVLANQQLPGFDIGQKDDIKKVLTYLDVKNYGTPTTEWAVIRPRSDSLLVMERNLPEKQVPSVVGMGLKDALYALENRGLAVKVEGYGKVVQQSLRPGTPARGQTIKVTLR
ncbi:MAG: transpeptidase family protein [Lewinellaceae bacterium]|nr:transpeptidase family protein [Lewinellaceae bacterium]